MVIEYDYELQSGSFLLVSGVAVFGGVAPSLVSVLVTAGLVSVLSAACDMVVANNKQLVRQNIACSFIIELSMSRCGKAIACCVPDFKLLNLIDIFILLEET